MVGQGDLNWVVGFLLIRLFTHAFACFPCRVLAFWSFWEGIQTQEVSSAVAVDIVGCMFLPAVYAVKGCIDWVIVSSVVLSAAFETGRSVACLM